MPKWSKKTKFQALYNPLSTKLITTVYCKRTDGEEDRRPNEDVRIEGNSGSDGKGEWSEMVRACVKEG